MRVVLLAACAWVVLAQTPAQAADCTRGMLWPYVRAQGDCLTPGEIAGGMKGAYTGPVNANPDVAAIPMGSPAAGVAPASNDNGSLLGFLGLSSGSSSSPSNIRTPGPAEVACRKGALWPFLRNPGDCLTDQEKKQPEVNVGGVFRGSQLASLPASAGPSVLAPGAAPIVAATTVPSAANCRKGALWPFLRSPGDCLTDAEKVQQGKDAVYRAEQLPARPAAAPPAAVAQASPAPQLAKPAAPAAPVAAASAPAAPTPAPAATRIAAATAAACNKGLFWPFARSTGDCLTDAEKRNPSNDGIFHDGSPESPASASVAAAAAIPAAANSAEACHKGLFWPFARKTGDCLTDAEKRNPKNDGIFHDGAPETAAPPSAVIPASASPAAPVAMPAVATPASPAAACHKGLAWPFARETGDCLTDAEKRNPNNDGIYHAD